MGAAVPGVEVRARCHAEEKVCAVEMSSRSPAAINAAKAALEKQGYKVGVVLEAPKGVPSKMPVEIRFEKKE